jgi:thioredoxin reductase
MHDLIILGGGPAGLTATMYAVQKRLDILLITRDLGGKTNYHLKLPFIERHMMITGDEIISRFSREVDYLDFVHVMDNADTVTKIVGGYEVRLSSGATHQTRSLIVCTGAKAQLLNVPGEMEFMNRGLCYSAISYAQFFIDRSAAVVGDGDLALRAVAELARHASHVTLIAPTVGQTRSPVGKKLEAMPQVTFLTGYHVKEVKGDNFARSVVVSKNGDRRELDVDAVFIEMDLIPRSAIVSHLVELDDKGRIIINVRNETSAPGIFAAGDVTNSFSEQALISIGEGAKALLGAYEYLLKTEISAVEREPA